MSGVFAHGTVLWYWYDEWIVAGALGAMLLLTLFILARLSWSKVVSLGAKIIAVLATVVAALVVIDRAGGHLNFVAPQAMGYGTMAGAVLTLGIGIATLLMTRTRASAEPRAFADGVTPQESSAGGTVQMTRPSPGQGITPVEGTATAFAADGTQAVSAETFAVQRGQTAQVLGATQVTTAAATAAATQATSRVAAHLRISTGTNSGRVFDITKERTTIGRSSDNDVVLTDPTVSRHHACIAREGSGYVIEDLGSTSGTIVDGATGARHAIRSGSVLTLGDTKLGFEIAGQPSASPVSGPATPVASSPEPATAAVQREAGAATSGATMVLGQQGAPAWFLVRRGAEAGRSFDIRGESAVIGRSESCHIKVTDNAVSQEHALVRVRSGRYVLMDIGSRNGTHVNGQLLSGIPLKEGSQIMIGSTELTFTTVRGGAPQAGAGGKTAVIRPQGGGVLLVRSGQDAGRSFDIGNRDMVIGRDPGAGGVQLRDAAASRRHALVRSTDQGFAVFDFGSANGTTVDGVSITGRELHDGDVVTVGQTELQFVESQKS